MRAKGFAFVDARFDLMALDKAVFSPPGGLIVNIHIGHTDASYRPSVRDISAIALDLSIVIVSWNCRVLIGDCLRYVMTSDLPYSHEIILVDNDSADGTAEYIESHWPEVRLVRSGGNLGFARGNNLGFAIARGRLILLLNPDCFVTDPTVLRRTVEQMDSYADLGACGVRVTYPDGRHQVGDAGYRPTPSTIINHAFTLSALSPMLHGIFLTRPPLSERTEVDWITGAYLMVRASVIEAVGGLDGDIFMYGEDVEWGCRMRDAGIKIGYFGDLSVVHLQGGTQVDPSKPPSTKWLDGLVGVYDRFYPGRRIFPRVAFFLGFGLRSVIYRLKAMVTGDGFAANRARAMTVFAWHALRY